MKVTPIEGSPTCFLVESRSCQCPNCTRKYGRKQARPGDMCKHCGAELKRLLPYHVDAAELFPIGRCACPQGGVKGASARKLPLAERLRLDCKEQEALRCAHVREVRCFMLNKELSHFEKDRLKNGRGQKEDAC